MCMRYQFPMSGAMPLCQCRVTLNASLDIFSVRFKLKLSCQASFWYAKKQSCPPDFQESTYCTVKLDEKTRRIQCYDSDWWLTTFLSCLQQSVYSHRNFVDFLVNVFFSNWSYLAVVNSILIHQLFIWDQKMGSARVRICPPIMLRKDECRPRNRFTFLKRFSWPPFSAARRGLCTWEHFVQTTLSAQWRCIMLWRMDAKGVTPMPAQMSTAWSTVKIRLDAVPYGPSTWIL